ncbi:TPA: hypothetical protein ACKRTE_001028 [Providencia rettgeri]
MKLKLGLLHFQKVSTNHQNSSAIMVCIPDRDGILTISYVDGFYENQNDQFSMLVNKNESDVRRMTNDGGKSCVVIMIFSLY